MKIDQTILENSAQIARKYEGPLIGIIGATEPLGDYDSDDIYRLGYELQRATEKRGTLFTGGMPGVGIDVYKGIVDYCLERNIPNKFFILFPDIGAEPDEEYFNLANKIGSPLLVERAGIDMEERRSYVGAVGDVLVVANGSRGTLDEALKGMILGKEIVCLESSGAAAGVLSRLKRGEIRAPSNLDLRLIKSFDSVTDVVAYLADNHLNNGNGSNLG